MAAAQAVLLVRWLSSPVAAVVRVPLVRSTKGQSGLRQLLLDRHSPASAIADAPSFQRLRGALSDPGRKDADAPTTTDTTTSNSSVGTGAVPPGRVPLISAGDDIQYTGNLTIGSNDQVFSMIFDTTSPTLWVPSARCGRSCSNKHKYDSSTSRDYVLNGTAFRDGPVRGVLSMDNVQVGGFTVKNQTFVEVTDASGLQVEYQSDGYDGVVGLSFNSDGGLPMLLHNLMDQKLIQEGVFAFYFNVSSDAKDSTGELTIGGIDRDKFEGPLKYVPTVNNTRRWTMVLDSVKADSLVLSPPRQAELDANFLFIGGPDEDVRVIGKSLGAVSMDIGVTVWFVKNCSEQAQRAYPNITFTLGSHDFILTADDYSFFDADTHMCFLGLAGVKGSNWVLGQMFLVIYYAVFDYGQRRIGLAPSR